MESKLMTTSEPTTGACRRCGIKISSDQNRCTQCLIGILRTLAIARSPWGSVHEEAADRLESQEREIERLKEELEQMEEAATVLHNANETHWTYIKDLTARAEQAEKKNAELINKITKLEGGTWT